MPFVTDWSSALRENLPLLYPDPPMTPMTCLEIGSFEGAGSVFIASLLCSHPESRLYCVDPWDDVYSKKDDRHSIFDNECNGQYGRFVENTRDISGIIPIRGYSDDIVPILDMKFDFAYIDGEHSPEQVYKDAMNVLPKMKTGGIMLFDDLAFERNGMKTRDGIYKFLFEHEDRLEVLLNTYQFAVRVL